jgi:hypothetical protein
VPFYNISIYALSQLDFTKEGCEARHSLRISAKRSTTVKHVTHCGYPPKEIRQKKNLGWFLRAKFKVVKDACEARRTVGSLKMSVGSLKMSVKHDKLWEA